MAKIIAYNVQLVADENSIKIWSDILMQSAGAYNMCAKIIKDNNVPLSLKLVHDEVYDTLREKYPSLPAQSIIKTYKNVISAFRSIRSNKVEHKAKIPRMKKPCLVLDKRLYSNLTADGICLTGEVKNKRTYHAFIKYKKVNEMLKKYPLKDPSLFMRDGKLFITLKFEVPELPSANKKSVGVDLGFKRLFVTSDGLYYKDKAYMANRRKVRYLKRCLKDKGTKSALRHLRKLKHKEYHQSDAMCHKAVNALMKAHPSASGFVIEDLSKIKQGTARFKNGFKRKKHNNMMSQVPFRKFRDILSYKAPLSGKTVETVNPKYTSQIDSRSGKKDGERKGCRYYCKDGRILDADWNASINIAKKGKHPFSTVIPTDGAMTALDGRLLSTSQSYVSQSSDCITSPRHSDVGS